MTKCEKEKIEFEEKKKRHMKLFQKCRIPKKYDEFALEKFQGELRALFNRDEKFVFCPVCGTFHELTAEVKARAEYCCPSCGFLLKCQSEKTAAKKYHYQWSLLIQRQGEYILLRFFRHEIIEKLLQKMEFTTVEMYRNVYCEGKCMGTYMLENKKWVKYKRPRTYSYYQEPGVWRFPTYGVWIYPKSIYVVEKTEFYRYSSFTLYAQNSFLYRRVDCDKVSEYLQHYNKYPIIERLNKIGFFELSKRILQYASYGYQEQWYDLEKQKNVVDFLKLDHRSFKMLMNIGNPSCNDVQILQKALEYGGISEKDFQLFRKIGVNDYMEERYLNAMKDATLYKINRYIQKKCNGDASSYLDYLSWLKELGKKKSDSNLYPKDFVKAHDKVYASYKVLQDQKKRAQKKEWDRLIHQQYLEKSNRSEYQFSDDNLCILLPRGVKDLEKEGDALHHCVENYAKKVAENKTEIFFIRRKRKASKSFYTLEIANKKIIQCRTTNNKTMQEDVRDFVNRFYEHLCRGKSLQ